MGVPSNGWLVRENPMKMDDDWGYPYFRKPPYSKFYLNNNTSIWNINNHNFYWKYIVTIFHWLLLIHGNATPNSA